MAKKMTKAIEGTVVKIEVLGGEKGEMHFDTAQLPEKIQTDLKPFGAGHKLGDAAAGKKGVEAEEAINKVWEGLMAGDWTVRAPAAPKIAVKTVQENFEKFSDEDKARASQLLQSLGINLPGLTA